MPKIDDKIKDILFWYNTNIIKKKKIKVSLSIFTAKCNLYGKNINTKIFNMNKKTLLLSSLLCISSISSAWDGYDYNSGTYIEIDRGNLVREGSDIEYFDYGTGYQYGEVTNIDSYGSSVEVEVYDYNSGEYRTFEMDR